ncbi:hypothetical protein U0070_018971, partial [Myodes glareolus]
QHRQPLLALSLTHETLILQSIETVKVDGSGRYTFPGIFLEDEDPIGLAVFENAFFWANQTQLVRTSPSSPKEREVLLHASHASVSALSVLHRSQQPKNTRRVFQVLAAIYASCPPSIPRAT